MKTLLKEATLLFIYMLIVFLLGITPTTLVSLVVVLATDATWFDCITFPLYWIITFILWIAFAIHFKELEV